MYCLGRIHKKCTGSGINGSMHKVMKSFICLGCLNPVTDRPTRHTSVDIGASANLELVDKFCYLGDMLSVAGGDADAAVEIE